MKKNDFPTNPVAFAQYVWENIEVGDILVDRLHNVWQVTSFVSDGNRRVRINISCTNNEYFTGCYNGDKKKLTRFDLASKQYIYIDNTVVLIPDVEDWNVKTFVQNYNTLWNILDVLKILTKEECSDIFLFLFNSRS